jgi:DNA gyrase/topoisomerase IV subunit A
MESSPATPPAAGESRCRAKMHPEEIKGGRTQVIIDEIPYGIIRKNIIESIAESVKDGRIKEISDVNDHSGRQHKCRIVVDLKRDADPELVMRQLFQYSPCEITVSMINIALVNRQPRTMGLKELIQHFIEHRKEVITRRTRYLLRKASSAGTSWKVDLRGDRHRRGREADPIQQDPRGSDRQAAASCLPHSTRSSLGAAHPEVLMRRDHGKA